MQYYYTIRADVRGSSKSKKYQELSSIVEKVNTGLDSFFNPKSTLISLMVRNGDELFGIYKDPNIFLEVYERLLTVVKFFKVPLYIGLGYGTLDKETNDEHLVNGPSIWMATEALESISKQIGKYDEKLNFNIRVKVMFKDTEQVNKIYQTLFYLFSEKILKRTYDQSRAVELIKKYPNKTYHELYDLINPKHNKEEDDTENKRIKFTKYLQRAEYHLVNDLVNLLLYNLKGMSKI